VLLPNRADFLVTNLTNSCKHILNKHYVWGDNSLWNRDILLFNWKSHTKHHGDPQLAEHWPMHASKYHSRFRLNWQSA